MCPLLRSLLSCLLIAASAGRYHPQIDARQEQVAALQRLVSA